MSSDTLYVLIIYLFMVFFSPPLEFKFYDNRSFGLFWIPSVYNNIDT